MKTRRLGLDAVVSHALCFVSLLFSSSLFAASVNFLAFGDYGTGTAEQKAVAKGMATYCKKEGCQFVVGLGDNFYPNGVKDTKDPIWKTHFEDVYGTLAIPFFSALGNHDYAGNWKAQIDYTSFSKTWKMPGRYYQHTQRNVDFFVIDTQNFDADQKKWLESAIAASKANWKIVYGHYPILSYGHHGLTKQLVDELEPLLLGKVDFYLCGHEHDKQYLVREKGLKMVISGAASQSRPSKQGHGTVYHSHSLGFAHFSLGEKRGEFRFLSETGAVEFSQAFRRIGQ